MTYSCDFLKFQRSLLLGSFAFHIKLCYVDRKNLSPKYGLILKFYKFFDSVTFDVQHFDAHLVAINKLKALSKKLIYSTAPDNFLWIIGSRPPRNAFNP